MSDDLNAIPPNDGETERAALGVMFCDPRAAEVAAELLRPDDFYWPANQIIFKSACDALATNGEVDERVLVDLMRKRGVLEQAGGDGNIGHLIVRAPSPVNVEKYCSILRDAAEARVFWELSIRLKDRARAGAGFDELAGLTNQSLDTLAARRLNCSNEPRDLHELAAAVGLDAMTGPARDVWGLPCGIAGGEVDRLTGGWEPSKYVILAARTSMGKSTFALAVACGVRKCNPAAGSPLIISTEMEPSGVARAALAAGAGVHTQALLKRNLLDWQRTNVQAVLDEKRLAGLKITYMAGASVAQVRAVAKRHKNKHGLPLLIVDLAGKLKAPGGSEYETLTAISSALAALKGELQTCVLACVQINRAALMNVDKKPDLGQLKGTGSWEEDADKVLFLHRPGYFGDKDLSTELIQAKDRDHGNVNSAFLQYKKATGEFVQAGAK